MSDEKFWKTVGAVTIGLVLAGAIGFLFRMWLLNQALASIQQSTAAVVENANRATARAQREQAERLRSENAAKLRSQQAEVERIEREAALQHASRLQARDKEEAWNRFYRKPAHCDTAEGPAFVECANDYIRSKRKFEEQYAARK